MNFIHFRCCFCHFRTNNQFSKNSRPDNGDFLKIKHIYQVSCFFYNNFFSVYSCNVFAQCWGSLSMARQLERQRTEINRKRIQQLMRLMAIKAVYPTNLEPAVPTLNTRSIPICSEAFASIGPTRFGPPVPALV